MVSTTSDGTVDGINQEELIMASNKLTDTKIKGKLKVGKHTDGEGLYLVVLNSGIKSFRRNYRYRGKQFTHTYGKYPAISLSKARELNRQVSAMLADNIDPKQEKKSSKITGKLFSEYAYQWLKKQKEEGRAENTLHDRIDKNLVPQLDKLDVEKVTTADLREILQVVSKRGARETAIRLASVLRRIFNELLILGLIKNNPAQGLNELLVKPDPKKKSNFNHITDAVVFGRLLKAIDNPPARQDFTVSQALKFMPLVFLRPINVRELKWSYVDFERKIITIPADKMKAGKKLKVPLAIQALKILTNMQQLTGSEEFVFITGHSRNGNPISENTTTRQLRNKIIDPVTDKPFKVTSHGFRHTASTLMNELGYNGDAIELQLAHCSKDRIRATYNKAELMAMRTKMMQNWADYLDGLKGENVVQFRKVA